jgi:hypothetical protein
MGIIDARVLSHAGVVVMSSGMGTLYGVDVMNPQHVQVRCKSPWNLSGYSSEEANLAQPAQYVPAAQSDIVAAASLSAPASAGLCLPVCHHPTTMCFLSRLRTSAELRRNASLCYYPPAMCLLCRWQPGSVVPPPCLQPIARTGRAQSFHEMFAPFVNGTRLLVTLLNTSEVLLYDSTDPWNLQLLQVG